MLPLFHETAGRPLICPSLLSCDFARIAEEIELIKDQAEILHCDIMDGHFVPNLTFGPPVLARIRQATNLLLDVHLMVDQPEAWLEPFAKAGADSLVFHIESTVHSQRLATQIRDLGCTPGVAINPGTPLTDLTEILPFVDLVLVMSVNPGFGGQSFISQMLDKVQSLRQIGLDRGLSFHIQVDGGINKRTAAQMVKAGANLLVAGNAIFGADDPALAAAEIRQSAQSAYADTLATI
ncbi:MAG: ribulose-phosphate 3-epimerase [Clostridiaceae bacterium]|jgi:ribulose-phosphate 3-epimerase|nr:ribulose-phosphate 3-epimerase [Clostridiaceae bacterium]